MCVIKLSKEQRDEIINSMDNQTKILSFEEIETLATKLNEKIDIPFLDDKAEQVVLVKIVRRFDSLLYQNLPNELYSLVRDAGNGISDEDAEKLKSVLGTRLNSKFDIPYLPEWVEQEIFETLLGLIVNYMRKNYSILEQPA